MSNMLSKSIRKILMAGGASIFAAGVISTATAALGVQNPPPGPGQVADHFGVVPNFANSPQPIHATVTIDPPPATAVGGKQATAAATTYDYVNNAYIDGIADIQLMNGGSGYDVATPPAVTITGYAGVPTAVPPILGASGAAATAHVNGVISVTLSDGGSGYMTAPNVTISPPDVAAGVQATATATINNLGAVTGITITNPGSGYLLPPTIIIDPGFTTAAASALVNPNPGVITSVTVDAAGAGYAQPIAGTGIRKFVDSMPSLFNTNLLGQTLPIATPTALPDGSDYYVIAEVNYTQKLHSDLPPTHLRGYVQLDATTGAQIGKPQYLGPIIVAQKDRAVRIKLVNKLDTVATATTPGSELPFPVDHTYMGADKGTDKDNRTALHLHGGNTPWISDGLPRQWIKPAGEVAPLRGESTQDVPDMWFDASGNLIQSCTGKAVCATAGATNNPGAGALSFYWTNQQSARLMFYHDHAEGITRLNVYDGLAAGYVLQDATEQAMINGGLVSERGVSTTYTPVLPGLADTIPLVIQEKTFVPDDTAPVVNFYGPFRSQLESQDPTWRWGTKRADKNTGVVFGQYDAVAGTVAMNGTGDLWVPHVYMTNQNPGDIKGTNPMGRWDYGPWFWPPLTTIKHSPIANPYYDPNCTSVIWAPGTCEGATIPGTPNGAIAANHPANATNPALNEPSGTPEAFNDTPLVNGTVYPYYDVQPKKYRLRILTAGNDRHLNLSLVVASSKNVDTTPWANSGDLTTNNPDALLNTCDGHAGAPTADLCTEVRMVPFDATQNNLTTNPAKAGGYLSAQNGRFPSWWYTYQKTGVVLDGRPAGVFDPLVRGPAMVQVGNEGGFLAKAAVIRNQPINYEYNVKNIVVTSVKEHALLIGPAERADVVVDFSQFAGSTLILYNDAPTPLPAIDLRFDYYTGDPDNTDTGGAFSTIPGYGPNSRTLMQFRVAATCTVGDATCGSGINRTPSAAHPVDDVDALHLAKLDAAVKTAFKTSQEPIVIPQAAHNATYGTAVTDVAVVNGTPTQTISKIADTQLTFQPLAVNTSDLPTGLDLPLTMIMQPKSLIEGFTMDYGRMNSVLGVEVPNTTGINQTSVPLSYIDPSSELVKISEFGQPVTGTLADGTQIWKLTHNGVDTHPIHFHLFHVQLINRVGWDGAVRLPDANELGWKDTVRMNPLEDVTVALRPKTMHLPFKMANSHRVPDPAGAPGYSLAQNPMASNMSPISGNASNVTNIATNYGWEYVWHCHILGHEENDMMRAISVASTPETPKVLTSLSSIANVAPAATNTNTLEWVDNSVVSNWVELQRATDPGFTQNLVTKNLLFSDVYKDNLATPGVKTAGATECPDQTGCRMQYVDPDAPQTAVVYYRLRSNNMVGAGEGLLEYGYDAINGAYKKTLTTDNKANLKALLPGGTGFTGYSSVTANSAWSNTAQTAQAPAAVVWPAALNFGNQATGTSAVQTLTLMNVGQAPLLINSTLLTTVVAPTPATGFSITGNTCPVAPATLALGSACTIDVTFAPTVVAAATDTLTITDNSVPNATQTVAISGNGVAPMIPVATLNPTALTFADTVGGLVSPAQVVTLTNTGNAPLNIGSIAIAETGVVPSNFMQSNNCGKTLAVNAKCSISVSFAPKSLGLKTASLNVADPAGTIAGSVSLSGTGIAKLMPATWIGTTLQADLATFLGSNVEGSTVQLNFNDRSSYEMGYSASFCFGTCTTTAASYNAPVAYPTAAGVVPAANTWYEIPAAQLAVKAPAGPGVASIVASLKLNSQANAASYRFRVVPLDPNSVPAGAANWTTLGSVMSTALNTKPGNVGMVTAQAGGFVAKAGVGATGAGTLTVSNWVNAANNTWYQLQLRNNTTGTALPLVDVAGNVTTMDLTGIPAGTYRVRIRQLAPNGESSGNWTTITAGVTVN